MLEHALHIKWKFDSGGRRTEEAVRSVLSMGSLIICRPAQVEIGGRDKAYFHCDVPYFFVHARMGSEFYFLCLEIP